MQPDTGHSSPFDQTPDETRVAPVLAENVKRLRVRARINKKRFALMVGIGRPFLNKIEDGLADPRHSINTKIADALETTPEYLLTRHDPVDKAQLPASRPRSSRHARPESFTAAATSTVGRHRFLFAEGNEQATSTMCQWPAAIDGAPGAIRTRGTRFRRAVLCPLSYGGAVDIVALNEAEQVARVVYHDIRARLAQMRGIVVTPAHADGEGAGVARHLHVARRVAHICRALGR